MINSTFRILSLAIVLSIAFAPSCKRHDRDIEKINKRIDLIENAQIKTLDQQVAAINKSLPQLRNTDEELKNYITRLQETAIELQSSILETDEKINTVNQALEKAINDAKSDDAALREELISSLNTVKSEILSQLNAAKYDMQAQLDGINVTIDALNLKYEELDDKIGELKNWTSVEIQETKDWASATFATLEQYDSITSDLSVIKQNIESLYNSISALEIKFKEDITKELETAMATFKEQISSDILNDVTTSYLSAINTAKSEITEAYKSEIMSSIQASEASMKDWVNTELTGYYTISETDSKLLLQKQALESELISQKAYLEGLLKNLSDSTSSGIEENTEMITSIKLALSSIEEIQKTNEAEISALKENLKELKADMSDAYKKAIESAVLELDGKFTDDIKNEIATVNNRIDTEVAAIQQKLNALETRMSILEGDVTSIKSELNSIIEELNSMKETLSKIVSSIISVSHVPTFCDGEEIVPYTYSSDGSTPISENFTVRFEVSPASVADDIVSVWEAAISVKGVYTKMSLSSVGDFISINVISVAAKEGVLSVVMSGEGIDNEFFDEETMSLNIRLKISSGSNEALSEYVKLKPYQSGADYFDKNGAYIGKTIDIDGLTWAPMNAGASECNIYGELYNFSDAGDVCPTGWRLPSKSELASLSKNYSATSLKGIFGFNFYGSNTASTTSASVFFPAAGEYVTSGLIDKGERGYYWSSDLVANSSPESAYGLTFYSDKVGNLVANVSIKNSVRCCKGE